MTKSLILFYKNSPDLIFRFLINTINKFYLNNDIPDTWKLSIIKPICKPNQNKGDLNSYRAISLTTTISKIIEKMIVVCMTWFLEKNLLFIETFSPSSKKT